MMKTRLHTRNLFAQVVKPQNLIFSSNCDENQNFECIFLLRILWVSAGIDHHVKHWASPINDNLQ